MNQSDCSHVTYTLYIHTTHIKHELRITVILQIPKNITSLSDILAQVQQRQVRCHNQTGNISHIQTITAFTQYTCAELFLGTIFS